MTALCAVDPNEEESPYTCSDYWETVVQGLERTIDDLRRQNAMLVRDLDRITTKLPRTTLRRVK